MELIASLDPNPAAIIQRLDKFAEELQGKATTSGLAGAASPVKKRMRQLAPKRSGALAKAVGHAQLSRTAKSRLGIPGQIKAVVVGPIRKVADPNYKRGPGKKISQGYKALWLEYGTGLYGPKKKQYRIPRKQKFLRGGKAKKLAFGGGVVTSLMHPGVRPRRFIARSLDAGNQIEDGFYNAMSKRLDRLSNA